MKYYGLPNIKTECLKHLNQVGLVQLNGVRLTSTKYLYKKLPGSLRDHLLLQHVHYVKKDVILTNFTIKVKHNIFWCRVHMIPSLIT